MQPTAVLVYRLLGTSSNSSDALNVVTNIYEQLKIALGNDFNSTSNIPLDWKAAKAWFVDPAKWMSDCCAVPVVIIMDSIDQLSTRFRALDDLGDWITGLRTNLPPNVKIILSSLPSERGRLLLESFQRFGVQSIEVNQWGNQSDLKVIKEAINSMISSHPPFGTVLPVRRHLIPRYESFVLDVLSTRDSSPLFLTLLLEIVQQWPSYADDENSTTELKKALMQCDGDDISCLINLIFSNIENIHGRQLVRRVLGLLCAAKDGLSESELDDLISCDDDVLDDVFEWWTTGSSTTSYAHSTSCYESWPFPRQPRFWRCHRFELVPSSV